MLNLRGRWISRGGMDWSEEKVGEEEEEEEEGEGEVKEERENFATLEVKFTSLSAFLLAARASESLVGIRANSVSKFSVTNGRGLL